MAPSKADIFSNIFLYWIKPQEMLGKHGWFFEEQLSLFIFRYHTTYTTSDISRELLVVYSVSSSAQASRVIRNLNTVSSYITILKYLKNTLTPKIKDIFLKNADVMAEKLDTWSPVNLAYVLLTDNNFGSQFFNLLFDCVWLVQPCLIAETDKYAGVTTCCFITANSPWICCHCIQLFF